jgi:hypothetical protein
MFGQARVQLDLQVTALVGLAQSGHALAAQTKEPAVLGTRGNLER